MLLQSFYIQIANILSGFADTGLHQSKTPLEFAAGARQGCFGVDVQMPGQPRISYTNVTKTRAKKILESFTKKGTPPKSGTAGHFGDEELDGIPKFWDHPMLKSQVRVVLPPTSTASAVAKRAIRIDGTFNRALRRK